MTSLEPAMLQLLGYSFRDHGDGDGSCSTADLSDDEFSLNCHEILDMPEEVCHRKDKLELKERETKVRFSIVEVREYKQTVGDNPSVSHGPPIQLDWDYEELATLEVDAVERLRGPFRRRKHDLLLSPLHRIMILKLTCGLDENELEVAQNEVRKINKQRCQTRRCRPFQRMMQEAIEAAERRTAKIFK